MKRFMKRCSVILVVVLAALAAAGCGRPKLKADKAVEARMKAELKGEFDEYAKLLRTDAEEIEAQYNDNVDAMKTTFEEAGLVEEGGGDEFAATVRDLLKTGKYEVKEAKEDDKGNYTVDIMIYPSDVMSLYFENVMEASMAAGSAGDELNIGDAALQGLKDAIAEQSYGDGEVYQVHINYNEEKKQYEFVEEEFAEMFQNMFPTEGMLDSVLGATGTVYDEPMFNWTPDDWAKASEEERDACCLKIIQELQGLTDEQMASIDTEAAEVKESLQQMKDGIDMSYAGGMEMSIGDYVEFLRTQMGM